jgi:hypothetical protein
MEVTDSASCTRFPGHDAWSREARRVLSLANELCITVDDQDLIFGDVRDLQTRTFMLRRQLRSRSFRMHGRRYA